MKQQPKRWRKKKRHNRKGHMVKNLAEVKGYIEHRIAELGKELERYTKALTDTAMNLGDVKGARDNVIACANRHHEMEHTLAILFTEVPTELDNVVPLNPNAPEPPEA